MGGSTSAKHLAGGASLWGIQLHWKLKAFNTQLINLNHAILYHGSKFLHCPVGYHCKKQNMNTSSLDNFMLENLQLSMLFIETSTAFCNLDKIFLFYYPVTAYSTYLVVCYHLHFLNILPSFFLIEGLTHPLYKHVEWPSEFSKISPLKQEGQNGWLTAGAAPLCEWEVHAAFSMLSKPASTVPVFLLIFVFDPMPQSYADMLVYRMVSSVLASRENRE